MIDCRGLHSESSALMSGATVFAFVLVCKSVSALAVVSSRSQSYEPQPERERCSSYTSMDIVEELLVPPSVVRRTILLVGT